MEQARMDFVQINPVVHYANVIQCQAGERYGPRMIYDYQFILVLEGRGEIKTPEGLRPARPGWLFYNRPAMEHDILPDPHYPFLLAGLHFGYRPDGGLPYPRGPYDPSRFRAERAMAPVVFEDFDGFPCAMDCSREPALREGMLEMVREYEHRRRYGEARLSGLLKAFLAQAAQAAAHSGPGLEAETGRNGGEITAYIHAHYAEDLSYDQIGRRFHFHPNHVNRLLRAYTGCSLHQYQVDIRMKRALELLVNTRRPISRIAESVGYGDPGYFARLFRQRMGYSPSQLRRYLRPGGGGPEEGGAR
ncbi:MAG: helix-turn-helix transcriptional regulator [Christensenellaceae bacterium]